MPLDLQPLNYLMRWILTVGLVRLVTLYTITGNLFISVTNTFPSKGFAARTSRERK